MYIELDSRYDRTNSDHITREMHLIFTAFSDNMGSHCRSSLSSTCAVINLLYVDPDCSMMPHILVCMAHYQNIAIDHMHNSFVFNVYSKNSSGIAPSQSEITVCRKA